MSFVKQFLLPQNITIRLLNQQKSQSDKMHFLNIFEARFVKKLEAN